MYHGAKISWFKSCKFALPSDMFTAIIALPLLFYRQAYVQVNMTKRNLPTNVMPCFRYLDEDGRGDLKRAISKFGGANHISKKANLIQMKEWKRG